MPTCQEPARLARTAGWEGAGNPWKHPALQRLTKPLQFHRMGRKSRCLIWLDSEVMFKGSHSAGEASALPLKREEMKGKNFGIRHRCNPEQASSLLCPDRDSAGDY